MVAAIITITIVSNKHAGEGIRQSPPVLHQNVSHKYLLLIVASQATVSFYIFHQLKEVVCRLVAKQQRLGRMYHLLHSNKTVYRC